MRRSRKPPSKAKQIRELKEQLQQQTEAAKGLSLLMGGIARTAEGWKHKALILEEKVRELQKENEAIKKDFRTCRVWSNLELCIQPEPHNRIYRVALDVSERYLENARMLASPRIIGNPRWNDQAKIESCYEIRRVADDVANVMKRKVQESLTEYFNNERRLEEGRIF